MSIGRFLPEAVKHYYRMASDPSYRELERLSRMPRYTPAQTTLLGFPMQIADARSMIAGYQEIFVNQHYQFRATTQQPRIIDCGANIGLSVIFFKKLFPESTVVAFEPDPELFGLLRDNVEQLQYAKVELHNKAIWKEEANLQFKREGGFSGRIPKFTGDEKANLVDVEAVRLSTFLKQPIDFLKIDIEGAEGEVIKECAPQLHNVRNLFMEYHSHESEPQTLHEILAILRNAGFRYHLKEAYTARAPFIERPPMVGMDLQLDIFAFRD